MNKVLPSKMEEIAEVARKGFRRLGLELLGMDAARGDELPPFPHFYR